MIQYYLQKQFRTEIQLQLHFLFVPLCFLWFLPDKYLELNVKFLACSVRFCIHQQLKISNWKNEIYIISSIILGSFFIMAAPPIYTQSWLLFLRWFIFDFPAESLLYVYFQGNGYPGTTEIKDKTTPITLS